MKRILSMVIAAAFAGAMPAVQAQSIPTMEACVMYAEADAAYTTAKQEANAAYYTAEQEADAVYGAAVQEMQAVYYAAIDEARTDLTQTYHAIYAEGGGTQSDVWNVMLKLLFHQRQLCTEHYGL